MFWNMPQDPTAPWVLASEFSSLVIIALLAVLPALALLLLTRKPIYGVCGLVFLFFAQFPDIVVAGPITVRNTLFALSSLAAILANRRSSATRLAQLRHSGAFGFFVLFSIFVAASVLVAGTDAADIHDLVDNLLLVMLVVVVVDSTRDIQMLVSAALGGAFVSALMVWRLIVQRGLWNFPIRHLPLYYSNKVVIPLFCLMSIPLAIALFRRCKSPVARLVVGVALVPPVALVMSGLSRGVTFAAVVVGGVAVIHSVRRRDLRWLLGLCAALLIVVGVAGVVGEAMATLGGETQRAYSANDVASGRIYLYRAAISMLPDSPLLGIGWNKFKYTWYQVAPAPIYGRAAIPKLPVHCSYLQVLLEIGVCGFAIYATWLVLTFRNCRRATDAARAAASTYGEEIITLARAVSYSLAGLLVHSVVDNNGRGTDRGHVILFALTIVLLSLARRSRAGAAGRSQERCSLADGTGTRVLHHSA